MANAKKPVPQGHHTVTPQLTLDDAAKAIDWYKKALGAEEVSRATGPDGQIMHADLRIGNSHIMVNDAMGGSKTPKAIGGSPASLWVYVGDCDTLVNRAVAAAGQDILRGHAWVPTQAGIRGRRHLRVRWVLCVHVPDAQRRHVKGQPGVLAGRRRGERGGRVEGARRGIRRVQHARHHDEEQHSD